MMIAFVNFNNLSRLMLLEENQIAFHSEDGLIFDGVKDYSRQVAEMIGLGSDSEFHQAGVSFPCTSWLLWIILSVLDKIQFERV